MPRTSRTSQAAAQLQEANDSNNVAAESSSNSMWTTRSRSRAARRGGAANNSASNSNTASTSSVSFTSPPASSREELSEAESYATRAGLSGVADDDEEEAEGRQTPSRSYTNASNLIGDSDGDDNNYNSAHLEVDSLAEADPAEVEARVLENLGWEEIGQDRELPVIDLERWKSIGPAHQQDGTSENDELKAIQASLLEAVQELEASDWMYPQPTPFLPDSARVSKSVTGAPDAFRVLYKDADAWADLAFNPLSTLTPLAPSLSGTFPSSDRVRAAVENTLLPDVSFLDAQQMRYGDEGQASFARNSNFPWAAPLMASASASGSGLASTRSSLAREVGTIAL